MRRIFARDAFVRRFTRVNVNNKGCASIHFTKAAITRRFRNLVLRCARGLRLAKGIRITCFVGRSHSLIYRFRASNAINKDINGDSFLIPRRFAFGRTLKGSSRICFCGEVLDALTIGVSHFNCRFLAYATFTYCWCKNINLYGTNGNVRCIHRTLTAASSVVAVRYIILFLHYFFEDDKGFRNHLSALRRNDIIPQFKGGIGDSYLRSLRNGLSAPPDYRRCRQDIKARRFRLFR